MVTIDPTTRTSEPVLQRQ